MEISEEKVDAYLKNPTRCFGCGFEGLEGGSVRIDSGMAYQDVHCLDCGLAWVDEYALCDVSYIRRT